MPSPSPLFRRLTRAAAVGTVAAVALAGQVAPSQAGPGPATGATAATADLVAKAAGENRRTPRNFTGYGFDQCLTPTQRAMDAWLESSPFWAVGIYISGNSRACRNQPNLTPEWVSTQLAKGWRLLPITLGPQASCSDRFPRYDDDPTINPRPANNYKQARVMGRAEAESAMAAAGRLGIVPGSTLWYDLEAFDIGNTDCRRSAMWFLSAWTKGLQAGGYVSGVYSSAGSGIKALDDVRVDKPTNFALPDRIWLARWDGVANTSSSYIREDGWRPGGRMKQYRGGHNETHGGVTINIDSNYIDLGKGSVPKAEPRRCGGVPLSFTAYPLLAPGAEGPHVKAVQCLLRRQGYYDGAVDGVLGDSTGEALRTFRAERGLKAQPNANARVWVMLHTKGATPLMKYGAASEAVRRLQRALNAASAERLAVTGTFEASTTAAVKRYQSRRGVAQTGVVTSSLWSLLQSGKL